MARPLAAAPVLAAAVSAALLAAGCQGGSGDARGPVVEHQPVETPDVSALPRWVEGRLSRRDGDVSGLLLGTADHVPGRNRVSFVVVRADNTIVQAPEARVYVARADSGAATEVRAQLIPLGPHFHGQAARPHDHPDATDIYVANVDFPRAGRYWLVVEPEGEPTRATGTVDVRNKSISPAVGDRAIPSANPTLRQAPAAKITTARPPDTELLRHSVADSIRAGVPFVIVFATPAFCQSRVCGPVVEAVDTVRKRFLRSGVRFIHVEVYRDNDPTKGFNRWIREWRLPTEPWIFVVDRKGVIRSRFEGATSVDELATAVARIAG